MVKLKKKNIDQPRLTRYPTTMDIKLKQLHKKKNEKKTTHINSKKNIEG
jgi:hypothetical protein